MICKKCSKYVGEPIYREEGVHIGRYCPICNSWDKWVPKEEVEILLQKGIIIFKPAKNKPLFEDEH